MKETMHMKLVVYFMILITFICFSRAEEVSNSVIAATSQPSNPIVHRGDSKEEVDKLLGASKGWKAENEETAYYDRGYVTFRDGKAWKWSILSDAELEARKRGTTQVYVFSVPPLSPQERAAQERLTKQRADEQRLREEMEMAINKESQSWQSQGVQSEEEARGMATYRKAGLSREQYEEDASFVRNLLRESKVPARRDAYNDSTSQPVVRYYANGDTPKPLAQNQNANSGSSLANRIGGTTFYSDGTTAQRIGNTTFYNDGRTAQRIGNATFYNNGLTAQRIGSSTFYNDGTTAQRIGNTTFYSDGSSAIQIGNMIFYNK